MSETTNIDALLAELPDEGDDRFGPSEQEIREVYFEIAESKARIAEREAEDAAKAAKVKREKTQPKPKSTTDPAEEQFRAENAKVRVSEVEREFGPTSEHAKRARAEYVEQQEKAFAAQQAEFDRNVRAAAATDVRRRITDQVRAEQDKMRQEFVRGLDLVKGADPKYFMHSFDRRYGERWLNEQIEARVASKLKGIETGLIERDVPLDFTKPRPLNATERVLAQQALEDRNVAAYADKVLGEGWRKRL